MTAYLGSMHDAPVWQDIADERDRQDRKWGDQSSHPDALWQVILTEEVGEVANAILSEPVGWNPDRIAKVRGELVQVAAVAVAWIEALDKRPTDPDAHVATPPTEPK